MIQVSRRPLGLAMASSVLWAGFTRQGHGQRLVQNDVSARTHLAFQVPDANAQRLLPPGWHVTAPQSGHSRGANLTVVLLDRMIIQDAEGQPVPGESLNYVMVLVVQAQHGATGAAGPMIVYGFSAKPEGVPGAYGNFALADGRLERTLRAGAQGARENEERWSFTTDDGEQLEVQLRYTPGTPARSANVETRNYSPEFPDGFYRLYRSDQGIDLLRSTATGVNRIAELRFRAKGHRLGAVFDGSEQLVSVVSLPWQVRRVYFP